MIDRFESALWKVDRARKHADDLEAEVCSFWAADPYDIEKVGYSIRRSRLLPCQAHCRSAEKHPAHRRGRSSQYSIGPGSFRLSRSLSAGTRRAYLLPRLEQRGHTYA
jgi:hypothetical protein